jgi:hypothetical protein
MRIFRAMLTSLAVAAIMLVGLLQPAAPASAAVRPNLTCGGRGLCLFTGTYASGSETFIQGNVPSLSVIGASTVRSAMMGGTGAYWDCWYLYPYTNYGGTPIVIRDGDYWPTLPSSRTVWGSARYYSAC